MKKITVIITVIIAIMGLGYWICQHLGFLPLSKGQTIKTRNRDNFFIALEANPTTGYQWELDFDPDYIQLVNRRYTPGSPQLVGSGGRETFRFLTLKSGKTKITFSYLRPWEKDKPPTETKVYEIIIK